MQHFHYHDNELYAEQIKLQTLAAEVGTPCYVYSRAALEENWLAFDNSLSHKLHRICYAVKANSNIAILNLLAKLGSGFDIVSVGELERVLAAGGDPQKIIFSGVGKSKSEIHRALEVGIFCFNIESDTELFRLNDIAAQMNQVAQISLRINPNIDAKTHPYIATGLKENKFGIEIENALILSQQIQNLTHIKLIGIACHIGSQLTELDPFMAAIDRVLDLVELFKNKNIILQHINIGGGLGVRYHSEHPPSIQTYVAAICKRLSDSPLEVIFEPGRSIIANAGILLTRVEYLKCTPHKNFAIVDTAMNDLLRPALYDAWQDILPLHQKVNTEKKMYDIVGPVCESADFLGKDRELSLSSDDILAIQTTGAYGFSMSSNYNSRPRAAEILIDKNKFHVIRQRETVSDLFSLEKTIP